MHRKSIKYCNIYVAVTYINTLINGLASVQFMYPGFPQRREVTYKNMCFTVDIINPN